ncbi:hypothetical protein [Actinocorallia populi]|uniref:hypothetical protein n=1 Tax=Actinocorallia populi TaxID=2079200 RepID=UPI000D08CE46|nr:hypothetical protein [Actinocorallia populi]
MAPSVTEVELARLAEVYGSDWRLWTSDEGHLYASRVKAPPRVAKGAGYYGVYPNVHAPTSTALEAELEKQAAAMAVVEAIAAEGL